MRYEFTSSAVAMAANGLLSEITPWNVIVDTERAKSEKTLAKVSLCRNHLTYQEFLQYYKISIENRRYRT